MVMKSTSGVTWYLSRAGVLSFLKVDKLEPRSRMPHSNNGVWFDREFPDFNKYTSLPPYLPTYYPGR